MAAPTARFDRRWIFLAMGLLVVGLYASGLSAPLPESPYVKSYFATIEALPPGSVVMLSADFDPASAAEILPTYLATIHHVFSRDLRIVLLSTWPTSGPYMQEVSRVARDYGKTYGRDWVELGFIPGDDAAMGAIGQSLRSACPKEKRNGASFQDVPLLTDVGDNMSGIAVLVSASAGYPGIREWIAQVGGRYGTPILTCTTAVQTPDLFAFYPRQLSGFCGAATGATQYLQLVDREVDRPEVTDLMINNQRRMLVQSGAHALIILLIVIGNVIYFRSRRRDA